tara:strand:- start:5100 stop:5552 length:453 start_codon:yes stop_codon:yes gene_type:complete
MSEDIKNEATFGEMPIEKRVENLYQDAFGKIESLDNMFKKGGFLEMSVKKLGGDISWFNDVRNALDNVYEQIEESQMGAMAHLQMKDESIEEDKECGPGEYYCRTDKKCKPIPEGYKVMPDGELVQETEESGIDKKLVGDLNLLLQRSGL